MKAEVLQPKRQLCIIIYIFYGWNFILKKVPILLVSLFVVPILSINLDFVGSGGYKIKVVAPFKITGY